MSAKTGLVVALIVGSAVLAFQLGSRLTTEAVNTIVGVSCGILASIPVSLGLLIAISRQRERTEYEPLEDPEPEPYPQTASWPGQGTYGRSPYPPVVVLTPQQAQLPPYNPYFNPYLPPANALPPPPQPRDFRIVGESESGEPEG